MPDTIGKPDAAAKKSMTTAKTAFTDWGIPLMALGVGYVVGDLADIAGKLKTFDKDGTLAEAFQGTVSNPYALIAGFVLIMVGLGLWNLMGGWIGKMLGFFALGMAIALLLDSF